MKLKLFAPSRLQAVRVCAVIADRLVTQDFDDVLDDLTQQAVDARPEDHHAIQNYIDDVSQLQGQKATRDAVRRWLSGCYPSRRLRQLPDEDELLASGQEGPIDPIGAGWLGYEIGKEIRDSTELDEWWYEWNGELDEEFFNWVDELGESADLFPDSDGSSFDFA